MKTKKYLNSKEAKTVLKVQDCDLAHIRNAGKLKFEKKVDIPVMLTPHSGHIDPPGFWYQRARIADKFTVFFLGYLL